MEKGTMWKMLDQVEEGTHYEVYRDIQGNIFNYEDGELKHTEIYFKELSYDLSGEIIENTKTN
jgi:hypothetical protein